MSALEVDWVKWNVEEFREIVKRQADLETFYVCYEDVMELFAAYDSATAQIGDRLAELHRRIDRYIKENCALYEQLAASEKRADAYEKCNGSKID